MTGAQTGTFQMWTVRDWTTFVDGKPVSTPPPPNTIPTKHAARRSGFTPTLLSQAKNQKAPADRSTGAFLTNPNPYASIANGFSRFSLIAFTSNAPKAPSITR